MDSIYINFLKNPSRFNSMPIIHLEHRRWMFANAGKNFHTGFTWLGCGSFVPRAKVQRFLAAKGTFKTFRHVFFDMDKSLSLPIIL